MLKACDAGKGWQQKVYIYPNLFTQARQNIYSRYGRHVNL